MKTALITGISGQDGSYLAELLISKKYSVIGTTRNLEKARQSLPSTLFNKITVVEWDISNQEQLLEILTVFQPDEFYNFAAYTSGSGMYKEPVDIGNINGLVVTRILESILASNKNIKFLQASSREIFGAAIESPQNELTQVNPRSPYGAAKLYADNMVKIYREYHGLFACSAILFNHESPRRGLEFVTRKITHEAVRVKLGLTSKVHLGNLDAHRDWGYAGDTVNAAWLMLQQNSAADYVIATGVTHTVREFCDCAFSYLDLDYRDFVVTDPSAYRASEPAVLVGDAKKARTILGWRPKVKFSRMVHMMVDSDFKQLTSFN